MSRPLLITDCDEVLLHMVAPFAGWLDEAHDIDFDPASGDFTAVYRRSDGRQLTDREVWPLLDSFFADEMHRQHPVPGAVEALERIGEVADIIVLTNLGEHCREGRIAQLGSHGIRHRVLCNSGGKGERVAALIAEHGPGPYVFVDDLAYHHSSVAEAAPQVARLHMIADPRLAAATPMAPAADARIDLWDDAVPWILARLSNGA
jgi:hypothetical protein